MIQNAPSIVVYDRSEWRGFLISAIAPCARRLISVLGEFSHDVLGRLSYDTRRFLFHLDLTETYRVPVDRSELCAALRDRGIIVLNERVTSISKRHVQKTCRAIDLPSTSASRDGDADEFVMIKTDCNFGGERERALSADERKALGLRPGITLRGGHRGYRRVKRSEVDPAIWVLPDLVVERWIDNAHHVFFRSYLMLSRIVVSRVVDDSILKKMPTGISRENTFLDATTMSVVDGRRDVPPHLLENIIAFQRAFGLDYGTLDIAMDDHQVPYIIDVNATPYWEECEQEMITNFLATALL